MRLKELHLVNFKNHRGADLVLGNQVNCFLGDNGSGKTNVWTPCITSVFARAISTPLTAKTCPRRTVHVGARRFERLDIQERELRVEARHEKAVQAQRQTLHSAGRPHWVVPGGDDCPRRRRADSRRKRNATEVVGRCHQPIRPGYLEALIDVNKSLAQRNALLRYFAENRTFDATMLSSGTQNGPESGQDCRGRTTFMDDFLPDSCPPTRRFPVGLRLCLCR